MIDYRIDVLKALKDAGYSSTRLRREKILGEATMSRIRNGGDINLSTVNVICELLDKQPGEILRWIPDKKD